MKTIGVLGGLGPQATMDFVARVHRVSQELVPQHFATGYPPMVVCYYRHAPMIMEDDMPTYPLQADPRLFEAVRPLKGVADFLVVTSNTPHEFAAELEEAAGCPLLNMVDLTVAEVQRRGLKKVGVAGFFDPVFYTVPLGELGLEFVKPTPEIQRPLNAAVVAVWEGKNDLASTQAAIESVAFLRDEGVDGIILGCTEIPLLLGDGADAEDLINPAQLLAEAAVRRAIGD